MSTRSRAGFTTLEMVVGALVLTAIVGGALLSISHMVGAARTSSVDAELQGFGRRALSIVQDDLQRSGFDGVYPHIFYDGDGGAGFAVHDHEPPNPPQWSEGANQEIVFRLPADADGDGVPDLDADNEATWGAEEVSYVVVPSPLGGNQLERRVDGVRDRIVARFVDRAAFDDDVTAGMGVIPLNCVRVRIDFAKADHHGLVHRHTAETVFRLRNGGIVE